MSTSTAARLSRRAFLAVVMASIGAVGLDGITRLETKSSQFPAADAMAATPLTLWPQLSAVKVLPNDSPANAGSIAWARGVRGETVAVQVVISGTEAST